MSNENKSEHLKRKRGRPSKGNPINCRIPAPAQQWYEARADQKQIKVYDEYSQVLTSFYHDNTAGKVAIPKSSETTLDVVLVDTMTKQITVEIPEELQQALNMKTRTVTINTAGL